MVFPPYGKSHSFIQIKNYTTYSPAAFLRSRLWISFLSILEICSMTLTGLRSGILERVMTSFLSDFSEIDGLDFSDLAERFIFATVFFSFICFLEDIV